MGTQVSRRYLPLTCPFVVNSTRSFLLLWGSVVRTFGFAYSYLSYDLQPGYL
ncbi:hypothetical protein BDR07DRAFT_177072 [Suillus spraguei]|nr:hypothetical protein BDR07DRAFT_177072 [Suillus spraguei]